MDVTMRTEMPTSKMDGMMSNSGSLTSHNASRWTTKSRVLICTLASCAIKPELVWRSVSLLTKNALSVTLKSRTKTFWATQTQIGAYYGKSQSVINYLFNYMFDCYGGDWIYVNLFQQVYLDNNGWQYDPCQIDSSTGQYFDQNACEEMINNNACYVNTDANGDQNQIDDDQCAQFMDEYPCWTLPGDNVTAAYQEACYEYLAQYAHQTNDACLGLFGQGDDQNDDNDEAGGGEFLATVLSTCRYNFENNLYDAAQNGEDD